MLREPGGFASLCIALEETLAPTRTVVIRGPADGVKAWQEELAGRYLPDMLALGIPTACGRLPQMLDKPAGEQVNAWLCRGVTCLPPIGGIGELLDKLEYRS
jgi:uncharacterized protein YyaL (SSP411 family)